MKTLIIGANGQIGRLISVRAKEAGFDVRCMIRDQEQLPWFQERGLETVVADLEGPLEEAFGGVKQVSSAPAREPTPGWTRR